MAQVKELPERTKLIINLFSTLSIFCLNTAINFFLSPFIVRTLGVEANGFIQLSTNFASYISIVTVALNSMSGRFITISIAKNETEKAVSYYTSVLWANVVLFFMLLLPIGLVLFRLESLINIPAHLATDVKILFGFSFAHLMLSNLLSLWNNAFFAVNKLYLQNAGIMVATFIKIFIIVAIFSFFAPRVWYTTLAGLAIIPFTIGWSFYYKRKFLPGLCVDNKKFCIKRLKELVSSGIWRSIQAAGEFLLTGLNLLICNLFISPTAMGVFALSKVVPTMVQSLNWQLAATFAPKLTICYAKEQSDLIWKDLKSSFKILAIIGTLPLGGLIIFGREFFELWVPGQDAAQLHILSMLSCFSMALVAGIQPIGNIFAATNKVKPQAISVIISGMLNIIIVAIVLQITDYGIYVIAGTSVLIGVLRNLIFTVPASARYMGFKWHKFYIGVFYSVATTVTVVLIGLGVKFIIAPYNWLTFLVACAITAAISLLTGMLIIFNKQERKAVLEIIITGLKKVRGR